MAPGFISQHQGVAGSTQANLLRRIDGFWVLGVVVLSVRSLGGWWMIQRLRATAIADAPEQVRESFRRIFECSRGAHHCGSPASHGAAATFCDHAARSRRA
jgi:hypothetical protein